MAEKTIQQASKQARDFYEKGMTAIERGNLDMAMDYLCKTCAMEPAFIKARLLLRKAQIKKFKSGGAMSKIFSSVAGSTSVAKAMTSINKEPAKAMESAEQALNSNPYNMSALKTLAQAAEALQLWQTAVSAAWEIAREANPNSIDVLMELGRLYQESGQADKGRECFEKVLEIQPSHAEAFQGMKNATANEAMEQGSWEGSYRDNIKDKDEAQSLENVAKVFKDEDVIRVQMEELYKLTEQEPLNVSHWKKLADFAVQSNNFDYAIDCYNHAFELTKGADGNLERLASEARVKRIAYATTQKEAQLAADPQNETLQQELQALKQQQEAVIMEECESRTRRYPNDLDIKFELAKIYFRNNLIDKAIPEFQTAANNPKNKNACVNFIGQCFKTKGMYDMAAQRFKAASDACLVMDNLKKDILYNLGGTYELMNKTADAIDQYKIIYDADVNFKDVSKKIEDYYKDQSGKG